MYNFIFRPAEKNKKALLQNCLSDDKLTKDAVHYINDEIAKAKRNIEYYKLILNKLEG